MALITGIHHIALRSGSSEQFEEECRFYGEILGLPLIRGNEKGALYDTGNGIIELFSSGIKSMETGSIEHFAFATEDVDACAEKVRAAGYEITIEPKDVDHPGVIPYPIRIAFCKGPVGEEIEFFCKK